MSREQSFEAYGRYLVVRDRLNAVLDAAIINETQLRVFHGVLLVAQLNLKNRIGVLKAVLGQAGGDKAKAALPLIAEISQELKRNPIGQSQSSMTADGGLAFTRTEVGPRTAGAVVAYSPVEIAAAADSLETHVNALAETLDIDDAALDRIHRSIAEALSKPGQAGDEDA